MIYWTIVFGHRDGFGVFRVFIGVPRGYQNPPGMVMGHMGHRGERGPTIGGGAPLPLANPNWTTGGGGAPLSFSYALSFPPFPLRKKKKGGVESY